VVTDVAHENVADYVRRVFASFDARDVPTFAAFMSDDVRLRLGNTPTTQGKAAFVEAVEAFAGSVAGARHEILNVFVDEDTVTVEFDVHYTRHDGQVVTIPCCNVLRLRDGQIAEYRSYVDATPVYAEPEAP
jgi:ketosteroid isomerase-like protein